MYCKYMQDSSTPSWHITTIPMQIRSNIMLTCGIVLLPGGQWTLLKSIVVMCLSMLRKDWGVTPTQRWPKLVVTNHQSVKYVHVLHNRNRLPIPKAWNFVNSTSLEIHISDFKVTYSELWPPFHENDSEKGCRFHHCHRQGQHTNLSVDGPPGLGCPHK